MAKAKTITVEQTGSRIGRPKDQRATRVGLGLTRRGRVRGSVAWRSARRRARASSS